MPWQIVIFLSKLGSVSNIAYFMLSMFWNATEHFFNVVVFASPTFSGISSSFFFFLQTFYSYILITISWNFSYIMILISVYLFLFIYSLVSSLLSSFLIQLSIYIMAYGFSQPVVVTQLNVLLPLCELNNRYAGTNHHRLWKKQCGWSLIMMYVCCFYSDLCTEE